MSHVIWYPGHDLLLPEIVRAENCSLYDAQGNRYVDLEAGLWCTALGHGHPRVRAVLADQADRIGHTGFSYSHGVVEEAARAILALLGMPDGQCLFLCAGSEAVEYGVRVAQTVADRPLLLTMTDSYAGAYGSAQRRHPDEWFCFDWTACATAAQGATACSEACEQCSAIPFDAIGGLLFEPGSASGLVRFPPAGLIHAIVARIRAAGGLILVNEVTTGIGRTGHWFGYEHYGIVPDIVALGKGLGNGFPVSVAALAPGVCARLGSRPVRYAQSHQNDPLGAAIAHTVIATIQEEGLIERGQRLGDQLLAGLEAIQARTGQIVEIRARGLMLALALRDQPGGAFPFTVGTHEELVRRGYIVGRRPGTNVLRLDPSLTIAEQDIAGFLETLEAVLMARRV